MLIGKSFIEMSNWVVYSIIEKEARMKTMEGKLEIASGKSRDKWLKKEIRY